MGAAVFALSKVNVFTRILVYLETSNVKIPVTLQTVINRKWGLIGGGLIPGHVREYLG